MGVKVGYRKDTSMEKKEGKEKQERMMNCTLPRFDQTSYHLFTGKTIESL